MGMFDYVRCRAPLPGVTEAINTNDFQTKDLGCDLYYYLITEEGELLVSDVTPSIINREPMDSYDFVSYQSFFNEEFTGDFCFYGQGYNFKYLAPRPGQVISD